jgi:hypothetical protein
MEISGQLHDPAALPPEKKPPITIGQEGEWAPQPSLTLQIREKTAYARNRNLEVHPATCRYTDYVIPAPPCFWVLQISVYFNDKYS